MRVNYSMKILYFYEIVSTHDCYKSSNCRIESIVIFSIILKINDNIYIHSLFIHD